MAEDQDALIKCPHCEKEMRRRDLISQTVCRCRTCKEVISVNESWSIGGDVHTVDSDVADIDGWVELVGQLPGLCIRRISDREVMGEYRWVIDGAHPTWTCEVYYTAHRPGTCQIRLSEDAAQEPSEETFRQMEVTAARRACGMHASFSVSGSWGVHQTIGTATRYADFLPAVVARLAEAMIPVKACLHSSLKG